MKRENGMKNFSVIVLGIVFDPRERKVLIGRRENDSHFPGLTWCFPGGDLREDGEINLTLKEMVKKQTGLTVKNLGAVFSKTYEERRDVVAIYFLCEALAGKPKHGGKLKEIRWVKPIEVEKYFKTSFHPRLKEYLIHIA